MRLIVATRCLTRELLPGFRALPEFAARKDQLCRLDAVLRQWNVDNRVILSRGSDAMTSGIPGET
jgi:hypothetical protein